MAITNTTSTVQAIFALHTATAGLALLMLVTAGLVFLKQLKSGTSRPGGWKRFSHSVGVPRHSSLGTHFWLMSGLFCLMVAYAAQAAVVALQTMINSPFSITSAYSYPSYGTSNVVTGANYSKDISILSFLYQFASILVNVCIVGAIWMHANHLECNGTGIRAPGFISWIWNQFWILAMLGLGFAAWGLAYTRRGNGNDALYFLSILSSSYITRSVYVAYVAVTIAASTSATLEALLCLTGVKKNGLGGTVTNTKRILGSFAFMVLPIVWLRNAFSIAQVVILYHNVNNWSRTTNQALAFLFIIFGELANLAILGLVLLGAMSFSKTLNDRPTALTKREPRASSMSRHTRDDVSEKTDV
ncbi:uncharacterized protein EKO05_0007797 [Ascochyta rabiei]|uniref:Uncharacterized protein n=1 Tax=Didymella rabiei TaxID=5454 RepID=A0A162ZXA1_DIDRA|nr:uncharacterized protein EKO05_0007797 [Ascochyta rabiei]KZM20859.1 hypothetical protein ST47_g7976 [Ascochyta rabiei]UPX17444.1 hypothetical protein EKO05_0007797 [Ascochyta rabiei]